MRNAEAIQRRINEVKSMSKEDSVKALSLLADISYDIGTEACEERAELKREVDRLRKFIIGNGDPSNSIMARLKGLEDSVNSLSCTIGEDIKEIKNALIGDVKGDKRGLYDKVADNTRVNQNLNKVVWVVVLIIIGEFMARLFGLF